jgi:hypothetical protein
MRTERDAVRAIARRARRSRRSTKVAVAGLTLALLATGVAAAEQVQAGNLIVTVDGGFTPTTLPKKQFAPITLSASADIKTADGTIPPPLKQVLIDFDRNGLLQTKGLPVCQPSKLENTTAPQARAVCKDAIVGTGSSDALIAFPDQAPIPASSPLTIFNGPRVGGNPSVVVHAYLTVPAPTTFIIPSPIRRISGPYRYEVTSDIPPIAGGYGSVTHFDFKVRKIFKVHGKRVSYTSARCANGRLQAQGSFTFTDGTTLAGHVFRPCHARG